MRVATGLRRRRLGMALAIMTTLSACDLEGTPTTPAGTTPTTAVLPTQNGSFASPSPIPIALASPATMASPIAVSVASPQPPLVATPVPASPGAPFVQPAASPTVSPAIVPIVMPSVAAPTPTPSVDLNCINGRATAVVPTLVAPGTIFYVKGTGFKGPVPVTIGGQTAEVLRIEPGRLTCRVPAWMPVSPTTVPVVVKTCDATLQADVTVALTDDFSGNVTALDQGMLAAIYPLAVGTAALPADLDARTPVNTFLAKELAISPRSFTAGFPGVGSTLTEYFAVRFTGRLTVPVKGLTRFRLESDDGSRLYIDGQLVIDNDGTHPATSVTSEVTLNEGPHDLRVDYFQGPGSALALRLFWATAAYGTWYPIDPEVQVPPSAYGVPEAIAR